MTERIAAALIVLFSAYLSVFAALYDPVLLPITVFCLVVGTWGLHVVWTAPVFDDSDEK